MNIVTSVKSSPRLLICCKKIEIRTEGDEHYLLVSQLPEVERYSRMYYDLSINMEGIDAIHHLLERMEGMRREMNSLRNQLLVYRKHELEETEW